MSKLIIKKAPLHEDPRFANIFSVFGHGTPSQNSRIVTNVIEDLAGCWEEEPTELSSRIDDIVEIINALTRFKNSGNLVDDPIAKQFKIVFANGDAEGPFFDKDQAILKGFELANRPDRLVNGFTGAFTIETIK